MHYYQFNIKEYRKDTGHLTLLEHAIYRALIDTYYLNEAPLSADNAKLMRTHSIRTEDEQKAFKMVLEDFFTLEDDGYHHTKCDEELSKIYDKSAKARESAKKRWERKAKAMRTHSEGNATQHPLPNNPLPNINTVTTVTVVNEDVDDTGEPEQVDIVGDPTPSQPKPCVHSKIIALYHESLPELPRVQPKLWPDSQSAKHLKSRWNQSTEHQSMEFWTWFFAGVKKIPWYMGENPGGWRANLHWLVKRENFIKTIERIKNN